MDFHGIVLRYDYVTTQQQNTFIRISIVKLLSCCLSDIYKILIITINLHDKYQMTKKVNCLLRNLGLWTVYY